MQQQDLFGKTYDQQLALTGNDIAEVDLAPNRRISGEIVFEPMGNGIRVTARDEQHRVLWGYVASKETLQKAHSLVASYQTLQNLVGEELEKRSLFVPEEQKNLIAQTHAALDQLEATAKWLRQSIEVKKVTQATLERAQTITRIALDADRQMALDATLLKGIKSRNVAQVNRKNKNWRWRTHPSKKPPKFRRLLPVPTSRGDRI